jgi:hypothetical protein
MHRATLSAAALVALHSSSLAAGVTLGLNFSASDSTSANSGFIPPDTMGAVGPDHIMVLINGRASVYNKSTGSLVGSGKSLNQFWTDAGTTPSGSFAFDPRVIYDKDSGRWFAVSVDNAGGANNFLLAVSATSDPSGTWKALKIDSDTANTRFADFPTLGVDKQGVYLTANMFPVTGTSGLDVDITIMSLPKADLLLPTPSAASKSEFQLVGLNRGYSIQPAVNFSGSADNKAELLGMSVNTSDLIRTDILNPGTAGATLTSPTTIANTSFDPPTADQPGTAANFNTGDDRFSANTVMSNGSLWAVHSTSVSGRAAVEWLRINPVTNTIIQSGVISDPSLSFFFPSIAVNEFDQVLIGFSGSDSSTFGSSYYAFGETSGSTTTFSPVSQTKAGSAQYQVLDGSGRNRWGDYSATVVDPVNPSDFWTFQLFAPSTNNWQVQVSQLHAPVTAVPEPAAAASLLLTTSAAFLTISRRRRRP